MKIYIVKDQYGKAFNAFVDKNKCRKYVADMVMVEGMIVKVDEIELDTSGENPNQLKINFEKVAEGRKENGQ